MHASNIALLVLAASAAAPAYSAPLSDHARSDLPVSNRELSAAVGRNEKRVIESPIPRDGDESLTHSDLEKLNEAFNQLVARDDVEDFVKAVLSSRDYTARQVAQEDRAFDLKHFPMSRDIEIEARSGIGNFFKNILGIFGIHIRRDVDDMDNLMKAILQSRDDDSETLEPDNQDANDLDSRGLFNVVPEGVKYALSLLGVM